jgi:sialate O-acetylesterase
MNVDGPEIYAAAAVQNKRSNLGQPNPNNGHGVLFNAMINPFTVGPMPVTSFIWFQGESNLGNPASYYACAQPAMIDQWRTYFKSPDAFFGYVELEPWIGAGTSLATFRTAQLLSNKLPNVGFAIGTDIGDPLGPFTSIHPRNKKLVGQRLAAAAMTMVYDTPTQYLPPTYKSSVAKSSGTNLMVTVTFDNVPTKLVAADDHCKTELKVPASECAWFSITGSDNAVLNATATVGADRKSLVLSAVAKKTGVTPTASSFGMNAWPINTIMSAEGFPLQPWSFPTTAADMNVTSSQGRHLLFGPDCNYYDNCCRCNLPCPTCPIGCC